MTQATTSPFELSLAVNDFESAVGLVCGAADALWHYAQFSHDNTLHYLIDMECTHAGTLRERLYAERPLGPFEPSITVNEMEKPICDVYDGAYALWGLRTGPRRHACLSDWNALRSRDRAEGDFLSR